jgi:hypothetical protein
LTELLQDHRFLDTCYVRLDKTGYTVVEQRQSNHDFGTAGFCLGESLCLSDTEQSIDAVGFGPTPNPFGLCEFAMFKLGETLRTEGVDELREPPAFAPISGLSNPAPMLPSQPIGSKPGVHEEDSYLKKVLQDYLGQAQNVCQEAEMKPGQFCLHEPLCFETDQASHMPWFGPTPAPFGWSPSPQRAQPVVVPPLPLPSLSPWKDGTIDSMVQRTFIHAQSPTKNLLFGGHRRTRTTGDVSESTSARSVSSGSWDFADSPRNQDDTKCWLAVADGMESIPPTPMIRVPPTPLTPPGLDFSLPLCQPTCAALPVLSLSDLLR